MAKHPRMVQYLDKVQGLLKEFPTFTIQQVPRAENTHADALASLGSALDTQFRRSIPVEHLDRPSIEEIEPIDSMQIDEDPSWQDSIIDYLVNGNLPTDKSEARKVQQKAARYYMHNSKLIRRSYSGPHLTCIKYPQTLEVLYKIHDGECGNHSGGRSLAQKALNIGYFWPTMRHDSAEYVKKCDRCQRYKPIPNLPAEVYHSQNNHRLLCEIQDQATPVHSKVSARKWAGRGIQQSHIRLLEEKARRCRKEMGGRTPRSTMGLSHHQMKVDWRNPIFPCLWN
ncbi:unnamed protein product [Prunus brigantina]